MAAFRALTEVWESSFLVLTDRCLFSISFPFLLAETCSVPFCCASSFSSQILFQQKCNTDVCIHQSRELEFLTEPSSNAGRQIFSQSESQTPSPASAFGSSAALPPGTVQQLHLSKSLCDHSSKNQPEEDAAYQHVVIVIF